MPVDAGNDPVLKGDIYGVYLLNADALAQRTIGLDALFAYIE